MFNNRQHLGQNGEEIAARYLIEKGYKILARNFRCRLGEIDIVATHEDVLSFVEVKTRTGDTFGSPGSAVTLKKQRQISKAAQYYLAEYNLFDTAARFDVVSVVIGPDQKPLIELIPGAFDLCQD